MNEASPPQKRPLLSARFLQAAAIILPFEILALTLLILPDVPLVDMPNHIARAFIIKNLPYDAALQTYYTYHFTPTPYILGDLALVQLMHYFSPLGALHVWSALLFIGFPLSWCYYLAARGSAVNRTNIVYLLLLSYVSTNYFFLSGYNSFCFSVCLCFLGMGFWERWLKNSAASYAPFVGTAALTYLAHLAGFFFMAEFIGVITVVRLYERRISPVKAFMSGVPLALLGAWHLHLGTLGSSSEDIWIFRGPVDKLLAAGAASIRYDIWLDSVLFAFFLGFIAWAAAAIAHRSTEEPAAQHERRELLALLVISAVSFVALPSSLGAATEVDIRATLFMLLFGLTVVFIRQRNSPRWLVILSLLFAAVNTAQLCFFWWRSSGRLAALTEAARSAPAERAVLPVYTWNSEGRMDAGINHGLLYTPLRHGFTPDIFNDSIDPRQFPYFTVRKNIYAPGQFWYVRGKDSTVRWDLIEQSYEYVLVTKPYDITRIKVPIRRTLFENSAAAVLEIEREPIGIFSDMEFNAADGKCLGTDVTLWNMLPDTRGELREYEGPCEAPPIVLTNLLYDAATGRISFQAKGRAQHFFEGTLSEKGLSGEYGAGKSLKDARNSRREVTLVKKQPR